MTNGPPTASGAGPVVRSRTLILFKITHIKSDQFSKKKIMDTFVKLFGTKLVSGIIALTPDAKVIDPDNPYSEASDEDRTTGAFFFFRFKVCIIFI